VNTGQGASYLASVSFIAAPADDTFYQSADAATETARKILTRIKRSGNLHSACILKIECFWSGLPVSRVKSSSVTPPRLRGAISYKLDPPKLQSKASQREFNLMRTAMPNDSLDLTDT